jgi:hypothetical protein
VSNLNKEEGKMKKILVLMLGFLLIAVNLYAAGDLIVEGNIGIGTTTPASKLDVNGSTKINGGIWADGTTGSTPTSGAGTRLMWIPAKRAFRAGQVDGTEWDDANIGIYSFAVGRSVKALGENSFAAGSGSNAPGPNSAAFGGATVSGQYAFAGGNTVTASGDGSFGFGINVIVSGAGAFAIGNGNGGFVTASGAGSFAGGAQDIIEFGGNVITASGAGSFAWGYTLETEQIVASGLASVAMGRNVSATADNAFAFGKNFTNSTTSSFEIGFGQRDFSVRSGVITAYGDVGIGVTNPTQKLDVAGTVNASGGYTQVSDVKFKKDITAIESPLNKILNIKGVTYSWKTDEYKERGFSEGTHYGVIGQEIEKVLPDVVKESPNGEKSVSYTEIIPVLIEAVKEQQKVIEELKARVKQLEGRGLIAKSQ